MYGIHQYSGMIGDQVRMDAYDEALRRTVRPGHVVLDLGCGTGILALMACRLGAAHVYGVDPSPAVEIGRQFARDNGYAERITFVQGDSTKIELPQKADIIVSDIRGLTGLHPEHLRVVRDARARFLAPGGVAIPRRDILRVALAECDLPARLRSPADRGFDLSAARRYSINRLLRPQATSVRPLTTGEAWGEIDFAADQPARCGRTVRWEGTQPGRADGLLIWFDAELVDGVGYTTGPVERRASAYGIGLLPLEEGLQVGPEDRIEVSLRADGVGRTIVWTWSTRIERAGLTRADFRQSTFFGRLMSPAMMRRRRSVGERSEAP